MPGVNGRMFSEMMPLHRTSAASLCNPRTTVMSHVGAPMLWRTMCIHRCATLGNATTTSKRNDRGEAMFLVGQEYAGGHRAEVAGLPGTPCADNMRAAPRGEDEHGGVGPLGIGRPGRKRPETAPQSIPPSPPRRAHAGNMDGMAPPAGAHTSLLEHMRVEMRPRHSPTSPSNCPKPSPGGDVEGFGRSLELAILRKRNQPDLSRRPDGSPK